MASANDFGHGTTGGLEVPRASGDAARQRTPSKAGPRAPYFLPSSAAEVDRLDLQHYAARAVLKANYLAPLIRPARILDVGAGTGQWSFDMAREFPRSVVVGLDLVTGKPGAPANYGLVRSNLLDGLPFADDVFDLVHQRLLVSGIPVKAWSNVVADLVRVARPGGWIELVEPDAAIEPAGPATERLFDLMMRLTRLRGLDSTGIVFNSLDEYLRRAGAHQVERQHLALPIGEWGGRVGSFMASDFRALFTLLAAAFESALEIPAADSHELLRHMLQEVEHHQSTLTFAVVFARKEA
jgi:SAM-dependent methyltransferase